jgi:hypothetical protein
MINQKLHDFFNGISDLGKHRFMTYSENFSMFAVETNLGRDDDTTIVFINDKSIISFDEENNIYRINSENRTKDYSLITTISKNNLERGIYNISELPHYDLASYEEEIKKSRTMTFGDIKKLPTIKTTKQIHEIFNDISEHVSFRDDFLSKLAYQDDEQLKIETIFEILGNHDGKCSTSVKKISFDNELAFYSKYIGKYGDEPVTYIVNDKAYSKLLKHVEAKYNGRKFEVYSDDTLIFKKFNDDFYDFSESNIQTLEKTEE